MKALSAELAQRREASLYRTPRVLESAQGPTVRISGKTYLSFCSNDYLGLANHPKVIEALKEGTSRYGVGSGAAHLVTGHSTPHHALEEELAEFTGRQRALLFSTGYMANIGTISALVGRGDTVFEDRVNHASLLDGALLSQARLQRFPHKDIDALERHLATHHDKRKLVVTDGVFSMDGDIAPLPDLATLSRHYGAWLMVDDAHGLGVVGNHGAGSLSRHGLNSDDAPILVGTLGKAFGTFGAFVAGDEALIETLIQKARTYIYTTAIPPAIAHATRASLRLVKEEHWRRRHLEKLVKRFRDGARQLGTTLLESATPIQPLIIGEAADALSLSESLKEKGILITAIRPPTVAKGSARLRITFSANHKSGDIDRLLETLQPLL